MHVKVVATEVVMIMILIGALSLLKNFHILSHGLQLVEHGINIFILVPFPLEHGKPSMWAIFILHSVEQETEELSFSHVHRAGMKLIS